MQYVKIDTLKLGVAIVAKVFQSWYFNFGVPNNDFFCRV